MQLASLAGGLLIVLGGLAHAAEGDDLMVTGEGVNVRAEPQPGAPVLLQVHRPEPAVEVAREGEWVRVELPDHDLVGWIHGSLLTTAEGAASDADPGRTAAPPVAAQPAPTNAAEDAAPPAAETNASNAVEGAAPPAPLSGAEATANARADDAGAVAAQPESPQAAAGDPLARFRASVESLNQSALAAAGVNLFGDVRIAGQDVAQVTAAEAWDMVPEGGRQSYLNILHDHWLEILGRPPASVQVVDQSGRVLGERAGP